MNKKKLYFIILYVFIFFVYSLSNSFATTLKVTGIDGKPIEGLYVVICQKNRQLNINKRTDSNGAAEINPLLDDQPVRISISGSEIICPPDNPSGPEPPALEKIIFEVAGEVIKLEGIKDPNFISIFTGIFAKQIQKIQTDYESVKKKDLITYKDFLDSVSDGQIHIPQTVPYIKCKTDKKKEIWLFRTATYSNDLKIQITEPNLLDVYLNYNGNLEKECVSEKGEIEFNNNIEKFMQTIFNKSNSNKDSFLYLLYLKKMEGKFEGFINTDPIFNVSELSLLCISVLKGFEPNSFSFRPLPFSDKTKKFKAVEYDNPETWRVSIEND